MSNLFLEVKKAEIYMYVYIFSTDFAGDIYSVSILDIVGGVGPLPIVTNTMSFSGVNLHTAFLLTEVDNGVGIATSFRSFQNARL